MLTANAVVLFQVIELVGIDARRGGRWGTQPVAGLQEHGPANLQIGITHTLSAGHHFPCPITAGDSRQGDVKTGHAPAHPKVKVIDRHTENTHQNLPRTRLGAWNVHDLKHARVSVLCDVDGLHGEEIY
jgi:hypothetical protein